MSYKDSENKTSSTFTPPLRQDMEQYPFYNDHEQTYTDLTQLNSPHGDNGQTNYYDLYMKMMVHPTQEVTNPDWADGNYTAPKENEIQRDFNKTPNEMDQLYDIQKGANIDDLGARASRVVDSFLSQNSNELVKVACMDLTEFMKVSDDTLIHKSNKDLWRILKDKEGNVYIHRLFEGDVLKD